MEAKARESRNAYMRAWRARNKDKAKTIQERYWNKKAQEGRKELTK
ncbi:hypothetical protein PMY38_07735 [Clostridium tertium]|jgi:hypothetical protein|nr:hypothetical protein [Clostridium tertium]MDB1956612.1 hypothetical protein [Clostridium tertium]MDB1958483.1 hypothetical protein [Clostridium tertium]MDB1962374.1 hypothetical protein [Clostridium tertium]MDB1967664.1 hypothetical protein [Clostridium tertium]